MDIESWFQLVAICFLGAISPGPSLALVVNNTIVRGRAFGVATGLGHGTGIGLWALLTAAGIAKIIVGKSGIMLVLQSLGACLIGYIGFRTIMVGDVTLVKQKNAQSTGSETLIRGAGEGFLISLFNPKIALFFLAIFSHIVRSDSSRTEIVLMGTTAALIDALWYVSVALMLTGSDIGRILEDRAKIISIASGLFLILIALYLLGVTIQRLP
jgi:threonine/homoserine/homoserine lactone efflux protein